MNRFITLREADLLQETGGVQTHRESLTSPPDPPKWATIVLFTKLVTYCSCDCCLVGSDGQCPERTTFFSLLVSLHMPYAEHSHNVDYMTSVSTAKCNAASKCLK